MTLTDDENQTPEDAPVDDQNVEAPQEEAQESEDAGSEEPVFTSKEDRSNWIPPSRVSEITAERNQERERAALMNEKIDFLQAQLNQMQTPAEDTTVDVEPLYADLQTAIDEGRGADAASIQRKLADAQNANFEAALDARLASNNEAVTRDVSRRQDEATFQRALKRTLAKHPELNENDASFNRELHDNISDMMTGFYASGKMSQVDAFEKALKLAGVKDEPKQTLGFNDRAAAQRTANAAQSREQAPAMMTQSNRVRAGTPVDVSKMSRKEFEKFRNSEGYAAARGDIV